MTCDRLRLTFIAAVSGILVDGLATVSRAHSGLPVPAAEVDVARTLVSVVDAVATVVASLALAPIRIVNPDALTSS